MTLLKTGNLCKYFGGLKAVDGVDFELQAGEVRAIIGPNGAGKTTFVSLLCGRLEVTSGQIEFERTDITRLPAYQRVRRGIAYTFQITSIYPQLPVYENIAIAAQNSRQDNQAIEHRVRTIMERVGLSGFSHVDAGLLAYGHQRVLEVAMGLALSPKLLILDEPTQGLSDGEIAEFCRLVEEISRHTTILIIEHNMQVVMSLAQRITVFNQGQVLAEGTPQEIKHNPSVQAAYLGT